MHATDCTTCCGWVHELKSEPVHPIPAGLRSAVGEAIITGSNNKNNTIASTHSRVHTHGRTRLPLLPQDVRQPRVVIAAEQVVALTAHHEEVGQDLAGERGLDKLFQKQRDAVFVSLGHTAVGGSRHHRNHNATLHEPYDGLNDGLVGNTLTIRVQRLVSVKCNHANLAGAGGVHLRDVQHLADLVERRRHEHPARNAGFAVVELVRLDEIEFGKETRDSWNEAAEPAVVGLAAVRVDEVGNVREGLHVSSVEFVFVVHFETAPEFLADEFDEGVSAVVLGCVCKQHVACIKRQRLPVRLEEDHTNIKGGEGGGGKSAKEEGKV